MRVGVYQNIRHKTGTRGYLATVYSALKSHGIESVEVNDIAVIKSLDVLLVLGGDGTILTVASECALHGVKILGVNCGHMGFLTDFEGDQIDEALSVLCSGAFNTVKRSMLKIEYGGKEYYALNEAVIQRCTSGNSFSNTVNLHAEIDGSTVDNFSSDGLIISTTTGSHANYLSLN